MELYIISTFKNYEVQILQTRALAQKEEKSDSLYFYSQFTRMILNKFFIYFLFFLFFHENKFYFYVSGIFRARHK